MNSSLLDTPVLSIQYRKMTHALIPQGLNISHHLQERMKLVNKSLQEAIAAD
jgi:hypothetical protein